MKQKIRKIHVIGIKSFEFNDLSSEIRRLFEEITHIAVPDKYIHEIQCWFSKSSKKKIFFSSKSDNNLIRWLRANKNDVILVSRGDPLWFGIGRILLENFNKEELYFYPSNTCIQLAFSKLKKTWQDIKCISIHGRDTHTLITSLKSRKYNLAVITDSKNNGLSLIKQNLIELDLYNFYEFWICEELGFKDERIRKINIQDSIPDNISDLNIVLLLKKEQTYLSKELPLFGISDNSFKTFEDRPNLFTKREIRIQILADLELPENGILWDMGAGCGTIGLEALRLRPNLELYCFDKRIGTKALISENAKRLSVSPQEIIEKDIDELINIGIEKYFAIPNRLIIGGCNKKTKKNIINSLSKFLKRGDIVIVPVISYEILIEIKNLFNQLNFKTKLNLIQTYKSLSITDGTRLDPNNPVFILRGKKL
tara:strand:+ start:3442 stop:4716 length:1275 start_codon:yes stop_codon:yes gene_type:complete